MPVRLIRIERGGPALHVRMCWSSIFAGAFLTLGFGLFFLLLGNAVGLNAANTVRADISGTLRSWSWVYVASSWVFSFFLGGILSTRSAEIDSPSSGVIHGLTSWGLASTLIGVGGAVSSIGFRALLVGLAVDRANWLSACIIGLGAVGAAMGGLLGKFTSTEAFRMEKSPEVSPARAPTPSDRRVA